jgi:hypothetical protein
VPHRSRRDDVPGVHDIFDLVAALDADTELVFCLRLTIVHMPQIYEVFSWTEYVRMECLPQNIHVCGACQRCRRASVVLLSVVSSSIGSRDQ